MTEVLFTTVIRTAAPKRGGELVLLDWPAKTVRASLPMMPTRPEVKDPNPRGNTRGGRGIWLTDQHVYAASFDQVHRMDRDLRSKGALSNGLMVGLHEVFMSSPGRLWVTATSIDAALEIDLASGGCVASLWPREMEGFRRELGVSPMHIDKRADLRYEFMGSEHTRHPSHLHLNALASWKGELHALLSSFGAIANLERGEVVLRHSAIEGGHNLSVAGDLVFVNSTREHRVCAFDLASGDLVTVIQLEEYDWVKELLDRSDRGAPWRRWRLSRSWRGWRPSSGLTRRAPAADPLFVRGLQVVGDHVYVGISPASVLLIDWRNGDLLDAYQYSDDQRVCVHGLAVREVAAQ